MMASKTVIYWFRKALRLHDNDSLVKAIEIASATQASLLMIFVLDPVFFKPACELPSDFPLGSGVGRASNIPLRFLCEALGDLSDSLATLNSTQQLMLLVGQPLDVIPDIWKRTKATHLCFEPEQNEPYGRKRDQDMMAKAKSANIEVIASGSHSLIPLSKYASKPRPGTYQGFISLFNQLGPVPEPLPKLASLPNAPANLNMKQEKSAFDIVGVPKAVVDGEEHLFPGGETEGLSRLKRRVIDAPSWVRKFSKPDSSPCVFDPQPSTTALSPYLTFGCLSARQFYKALMDIEKSSKGEKQTAPPESLKGQLLWREHFYVQSYHLGPLFDRMEGNPICKQIPWKTWDSRTDNQTNEAFKNFMAWKEGRTGHPFIDACMRQLRQTGWMHHLARHMVACFLTRGDLFVHWEHGRDAFAEFLVDGDWALNNANWMWLSCSSFFYQYFRVYGPESFPKKYDPNGNFVRKFVPELKGFPKEFIYTPWKSPLALQKSLGCIIGKDYPKPIVPDHGATSKHNIEVLKAAYDASSAPKAKKQRSMAEKS